MKLLTISVPMLIALAMSCIVSGSCTWSITPAGSSEVCYDSGVSGISTGYVNNFLDYAEVNGMPIVKPPNGYPSYMTQASVIEKDGKLWVKPLSQYNDTTILEVKKSEEKIPQKTPSFSGILCILAIALVAWRKK